MSTALVRVSDVEASVVPSLIATGALSLRDVAQQLEAMAPEDVAAVLGEMPVMMAAAVCRANLGCGDEVSLLPYLSSDRAAEVVLTDLTMFRQFGGELDAFRRLVFEGVSLDEMKAEEDARTVEITNVRGQKVLVSLAIDLEQTKTYLTTLMNMDDERRDEMVLAIGEETIGHLCALVINAIRLSDDLEHDEEWLDQMYDSELYGVYLRAPFAQDTDRLFLEQEVLDPHIAAMERNFASAQALFARHEGESAEDLIATLK